MTVRAEFNLKGEIETMNETEKKIETEVQENAPVQAAAPTPDTVNAEADVALQAAKGERERVVKIKAICNGEFDKIERFTGLNIRKFSDAVSFRVLTILYKLINK